MYCGPNQHIGGSCPPWPPLSRPHVWKADVLTPLRSDSTASSRRETRQSSVAQAAPMLAQYSVCWASWRVSSFTWHASSNWAFDNINSHIDRYCRRAPTYCNHACSSSSSISIIVLASADVGSYLKKTYNSSKLHNKLQLFRQYFLVTINTCSCSSSCSTLLTDWRNTSSIAACFYLYSTSICVLLVHVQCLPPVSNSNKFHIDFVKTFHYSENLN